MCNLCLCLLHEHIFLSEAEAARDAGMQVVLLNRPGNAPLTDDDKTAFSFVDTFDNLKINLTK